MDKQTLSGYGWIVIITLVLAVLLALATPFGTYVGDGVVTTINGLINTSSKAVDENQIDTMSDKWENKFSTFDKAGSVNGGGPEEEALAPGLYDENGVMTKSWEQLIADEDLVVTNGELKGGKIDTEMCLGGGFFDLEGKLVIDSSVTSIADNAFCCPCFSCASAFNEVIIPNSVTSIGYGAFQACSNLKSINIPDSVTSIGDNIFDSCTSLSSIKLPNNMSSIGSGVFSYCSNLKSINIPEGIKNISLIGWDSGIETIDLPSTVESFEGAFWCCSKLTTVNYNGSIEEWNSISKDADWNNTCPEITVHCIDGDIVIPAWTN